LSLRSERLRDLRGKFMPTFGRLDRLKPVRSVNATLPKGKRMLVLVEFRPPVGAPRYNSNGGIFLLMGPLGTQEMVFIFILALLLFGPKKLPELGRTFGKALTEFRKAQAELKTTFDREMKNLERDTGIQELVSTSFQSNSYNYDHSTYDPTHYEDTYDGSYSPTASHVDYTSQITGASAPQGTGSTAALQVEAAAGSIASGHMEHAPAPQQSLLAAPAHADSGHPAPGEAAPKTV
jgi:TatA/E family protein of Tat protein translocase